MYSGALKKQVQAPTATRVALAEYEALPGGYARRAPRRDAAAGAHCPASFVLFYGDLSRAGAERGLLLHGQSLDLWHAIARCAAADAPPDAGGA